jgi:hypothetical protein
VRTARHLARRRTKRFCASDAGRVLPLIEPFSAAARFDWRRLLGMEQAFRRNQRWARRKPSMQRNLLDGYKVRAMASLDDHAWANLHCGHARRGTRRWDWRGSAPSILGTLADVCVAWDW